MEGETPQTLSQGLVSGLFHPVIGPDHLACLLLIGALAGLYRSTRAVVPSFVLGSLAGCVAHLTRTDLPHATLWLALSLVLLGVGTLLRRAAQLGAPWLAAAGAGLLHGYAYGESMVGSEPTPLGAYLLGLGLVQVAVMTLSARLAREGAEGADAMHGLVQRAVGALAVISVALGALGIAS
jgi:urease accessory protein